MSLITMCVHDTEENGRSELTRRTMASLYNTVDFSKHRLTIVDNNSCEETKDLLLKLSLLLDHAPKVIFNDKNIGTARAINLSWKDRNPGEHAVKIDNDVEIFRRNWVDEMEEAIQRDPKIGIIGLKRKDIIQSPWHTDPDYKSELIMLPHEPGQRWITVEKTNDIIGTCTMFNSALLDKVGYSYQPGLYGYEDVLFSHRSRLAGFYNGFLNHIDIDHIDPGQTEYTDWKSFHAGEKTQQMIKVYRQYLSGERSIYEQFY